MNKRYDLLSEYQVNNIDKYNKLSINRIPKIIIIFDEFADFILN
jgi:DNA segregation ATPase FtsK/SpoIIIE-like protein